MSTEIAAMTDTPAMSFKSKPRPWWLMLIDGILVFVVGAILLFASPAAKVDVYMFLVWALGFYWIFRGILDIVSMFIDRTAWGWKLLIGIVSIVAGGYIIAYPVASALALPKVFILVMGIWGLMYGIILLIMAFQGGGWGAGILGVLGIIFGFILMSNYYAPGMGLAMLWTMAVFALIGGIVMVVQAFRLRSA